MPIVMRDLDALESIIPFDNPKHPRLPGNKFPKGGKAGLVVQAGRVAWITGKYLYKYHKKAMLASIGLSTGLFLSQSNIERATQSPSKFQVSQTRSRRGRRFKRRYKQQRAHCCKCC